MIAASRFLALTLLSSAAVATVFVAGCKPDPEVKADASASSKKHDDARRNLRRPQRGRAGNKKGLARPHGTASASAAPADSAVAPAGPKPDPVNGKFSLEDATAGITGTGDWIAKIETDQGTLQCRLAADKAPVAVANFIGLARGLRPFLDGADWVKKPAFDGTVFFRVNKGAFIQGGDSTATHDAGYAIADEAGLGAKHDKVGLLSTAASAKDKGSRQFTITDGAATALDGSGTIFGECGPTDTIHKLAGVATTGDAPTAPLTIKTVTISRGPWTAPK